MSEPQPIPPPEESVTLDLETVVSAFLAAFPTPTDEQLHQFSTLLGIDYKVFEEAVFKMFGEALQSESIEDLLEEEGIVEDDLDLFIVAFFTFKSDPTEEQIHALSEMIGVEPGEIEERVYRMLQEFEGTDGDEEDDLSLDDTLEDDDEEEDDLDPDEDVDDDSDDSEDDDQSEDDESEDDEDDSSDEDETEED